MPQSSVYIFSGLWSFPRRLSHLNQRTGPFMFIYSGIPNFSPANSKVCIRVSVLACGQRGVLIWPFEMRGPKSSRLGDYLGEISINLHRLQVKTIVSGVSAACNRPHCWWELLTNILRAPIIFIWRLITSFEFLSKKLYQISEMLPYILFYG